jgi:hypothetical protein
MSDYLNGQRNFVQEIRFQSNHPEARINWVAGLFYSHNKQTAGQPISVNFLKNAPFVGFSPTLAGYTDGPPYGPGASAYENFLGQHILRNSATSTMTLPPSTSRSPLSPRPTSS